MAIPACSSTDRDMDETFHAKGIAKGCVEYGILPRKAVLIHVAKISTTEAAYCPVLDAADHKKVAAKLARNCTLLTSAVFKTTRK